MLKEPALRQLIANHRLTTDIDWTHGQRLLVRVASGGRLDSRAGLAPLPEAR